MKKLQKRTLSFIFIIQLISLSYVKYKLYQIAFYLFICEIDYCDPSKLSLGNIRNNSFMFNGTHPPLDFPDIKLIILLPPIL